MRIDSVFRKQLMRYGAVGFISNLFLYLSYLLVTFLGMGHKTAMSLFYLVGVSLTFMLNKNWTFNHKGHAPKAFLNYFSIYFFGYVLNFSGLYFFVDRLGFNHAWVQGFLVVLIALLLFVMQKTIVFKDDAVDVDT
jgi:putative flippase GtrA